MITRLFYVVYSLMWGGALGTLIGIYQDFHGRYMLVTNVRLNADSFANQYAGIILGLLFSMTVIPIVHVIWWLLEKRWHKGSDSMKGG